MKTSGALRALLGFIEADIHQIRPMKPTSKRGGCFNKLLLLLLLLGAAFGNAMYRYQESPRQVWHRFLNYVEEFIHPKPAPASTPTPTPTATPTPVATPTPTPVPTPPPDPLAWLLMHKDHWPKAVVLKVPVEFPVVFNGKVAGTALVPAGTNVNEFLVGPTTKTHGAYLDVAKANLSPKTGLWHETPGSYGQNSIEQLIQFGFWYYQNGIDVLGSEPLIRKAGMSFPQVAFPNGCATNWGDASFSSMRMKTAEYMIAYARAHGDAETEKAFTTMLNFSGDRDLKSDEALFFYVPELPKVGEKAPFPRVSCSETHSLIFERNLAAEPKDALAYTVYGNGEHSGHKHNNGMAMELYGRGCILGVDPGAGQDYWNAQHHEYNMQVWAHNTVVVNGVRAPEDLDLKIENAEPQIEAGMDAINPISPLYQFSDTSTDLGGKAGQRRVMGIVRTSPTAGYYVDIFRSRSKGANEYQDYLYHNMGRSLQLFDAANQPLLLEAGVLNKEPKSGYNYFEDIKSVNSDGDFYGIFDFGVDDVKMKTWMLGQTERTVYSVTGPPNFRYHLPGFKEQRADLAGQAERRGLERPFVAIYKPFGSGVDSGRSSGCAA